MTKRDVAFLLIGFGVGVTLMETMIVMLLSRTLVFGVANRAAMLVFATPLLCVAWGLVLLRDRSLS